MGFDAAWWWSIDPASAFFTSGVFKPLPSDHVICGSLHSNEFGETDYDKFRILARRTVQAGVLSAAAGGQLERSDRYRQMLAPLGYEHELRLALSAIQRCGAGSHCCGSRAPPTSPRPRLATSRRWGRF